MKAAGYNAVCMYFNWSYHSPAPGVYDFTGVRDMDLVLRMAADTGLYVLARPGPYINGEVNAGGFPGWLTRTAAVARTDDPVYLGTPTSGSPPSTRSWPATSSPTAAGPSCSTRSRTSTRPS